ncbi:DUF6234 family protein [Streptomyces sp. NPDC002033]|uniref:DUF6234 family protein n=1 Tax=unclassified Streptomyces TaxID=2593676 RepID=UPI00332B8EC1
MTTTPSGRGGPGWAADLAGALLLTVLEAAVIAAGLYCSVFAAWDPGGSDEGRGRRVLIWVLGGLVLAAAGAAVLSGRAFRRRAPVTGCVQALVCAVILLGTAAIAVESRDELRPAPAPAPGHGAPGHGGTYGPCAGGGDDHACPGG